MQLNGTIEKGTYAPDFGFDCPCAVTEMKYSFSQDFQKFFTFKVAISGSIVRFHTDGGKNWFEPMEDI